MQRWEARRTSTQMFFCFSVEFKEGRKLLVVHQQPLVYLPDQSVIFRLSKSRLWIKMKQIRCCKLFLNLLRALWPWKCSWAPNVLGDLSLRPKPAAVSRSAQISASTHAEISSFCSVESRQMLKIVRWLLIFIWTLHIHAVCSAVNSTNKARGHPTPSILCTSVRTSVQQRSVPCSYFESPAAVVQVWFLCWTLSELIRLQRRAGN